MANVSANADVLVVDMVGGLLTGAVAERMGGGLHVLFQFLLFFGLCVKVWNFVFLLQRYLL